jgi:hypothetical protein
VSLETRSVEVSWSGSDVYATVRATGALQASAAVAADFDGDGVADVVAGWRGAESGVLVLLQGDADAVYQDRPEARARRKAIGSPFSPFAASKVIDSPAAADFLGAADVDADGHMDLVCASAGGTFLEWRLGRGDGSFSPPSRLQLSGRVTALTCADVNRRDGLADVLVGVSDGSSHALLVFESVEGAMRAEPEVFPVSEPVHSVAAGWLDEHYTRDVVVAAGSELVVVHGRDRRLGFDDGGRVEVPPARVHRLEFSDQLSSVAVGDFIGSRHQDIAVLSNRGELSVIDPREHDLSTPVVHSAWLNGVEGGTLVAARVSSLAKNDLVIVDSDHSGRVVMLHQHHQETVVRGDGWVEPLELGVPGHAAAVLAIRLNRDALSDLMVVGHSADGEPELYAAVTAPATTYTVTNVSSSGAGSLFAAITAANASPGADLIEFAIPGTGPHTIPVFVDALPVITEALTIDATTEPDFAGMPVVEIDGALAPIDCSGFAITGGSSVIRGLVINNFASGSGVFIESDGYNIIEGNFIGLDPDGVTMAPIEEAGVFIKVSPGNQIGGSGIAARNVIAAFDEIGVDISDILYYSPTGAVYSDEGFDNKVQGNYIGTDVSGTLDACPFGNGGITVDELCANSTIGGAVGTTGNLISGVEWGFAIYAKGGALIQGNFVGVDAAGETALKNDYGLRVGINSTAGGTTPTARNVLSGNHDFGLMLKESAIARGNYVGTNAAGTEPVPNEGTYGAVTIERSDVVVGGTASGAGNLVAGNVGPGISTWGYMPGSSDHWDRAVIQGNFVGTDPTGNLDLGNGGHGIAIINTSHSDALIGGDSPAAGNLIAFNSRAAVRIDSDSGLGSRNNLVRYNRMYANGFGIDLGSVDDRTANDPGDHDFGANNLQNFPEFSAASWDAGSQTLEVTYWVPSVGGGGDNATYPIEVDFYVADSGGQALTYFATDVYSYADFTGGPYTTVSIPYALGETFVAVAVDALGNTSELSAPVDLAVPAAHGELGFNLAARSIPEGGGSITLTVERVGGSDGDVSVAWATSNGTATAGSDYTAGSGTLDWLDGDASAKGITIAILDDTVVEDSQAFTVTLGTPTGGAEPGATTVTTVTILDDDLVSLVVDNNGDEDDQNPGDGRCATLTAVCTLRAAITEANARVGEDTISFVISGDISVSSPLVIRDALRLLGPGSNRLTLIGASSSGIVEVSAVSKDVLISDLRFDRGRATRGGALRVRGCRHLTLANCRLTNNRALDGGGALAIAHDGVDSVNVKACRFEDNEAVNDGGAMLLADGGTETSNVTVELQGTNLSGNEATTGGAIAVRGAYWTLAITDGVLIHNTADAAGAVAVVSSNDGAGRLRLEATRVALVANSAQLSTGAVALSRSDGRFTNVTISGNNGGTGPGGGLYLVRANVVLASCTVADNQAGEAGGGIASDQFSTVALRNSILDANARGNCSETVTSDGFNISSDSSCGLSGTGDLSRTDPHLDWLRPSGSTWLHLPVEGSPVIDSSRPEACVDAFGSALRDDQRKRTRPTDGDGDGEITCDRGAVEVETGITVEVPLFADDFESGDTTAWS